MGVVQLFAQYFLWSYYCFFSHCPHSRPNIAVFLTCKTKGNRGQYGQENESFLIPLAWSHSTGFLLYHGYAQEDRNQLYSWLCHRLWRPISRLPGNSGVHCHLSLVEVTTVTSWRAISQHGLCEPCSYKTKAPSSPFWHHVLTESGLQPALLCLWPLVLCSFQVCLYFFVSAAGEDFDNLINPWTEPVQICVL